MTTRRRRIVSLALLAVLAWIPAQAAVCLGWCDDAFGMGHVAVPHASHGEDHAAPVVEAPCHGSSGVPSAAFTPVGLSGCDDVVRRMDAGVLPAKLWTGGKPLVVAFAGPGSDNWSRAHQSPAVPLASDSGPPCPAPQRALLVLRI